MAMRLQIAYAAAIKDHYLNARSVHDHDVRD